MVLAAGIAVGASVVPASTMSGWQWLVASVTAVALSMWLWHGGKGPDTASGWLYLGLLSLILSMMFYGADAGLELIQPPGSRRHDAASTVFGIELYQLLCPGLTVVAMAGCVRHLVMRWLVD